MGQTQTTINKVNFEDIKMLKRQQNILLINTLSSSEQNCLIEGTLHIKKEENAINQHLTNKRICIIVYGKNTNDIAVIKKHQQLVGLGFSKVYVYQGGLFEWLCLQDIYGNDEFPTTSEELDILKYKPISILQQQNLLENIE